MKKIRTIICTGILISVKAQSVELNDIKLNGNIPFEINFSELKSLTKQIDRSKPIPELMDMSAADSIIYIGKTYFELYRVSQKCELSVVYFDKKLTEINIGK